MAIQSIQVQGVGLEAGLGPRSADLDELRRLLLELGPDGCSAELNAAMQRVGAANDHALILMLVRELLALRARCGRPVSNDCVAERQG